jgi:hypothetical protein
VFAQHPQRTPAHRAVAGCVDERLEHRAPLGPFTGPQPVGELCERRAREVLREQLVEVRRIRARLDARGRHPHAHADRELAARIVLHQRPCAGRQLGPVLLELLGVES